jgi:hypothetical protein
MSTIAEYTREEKHENFKPSDKAWKPKSRSNGPGADKDRRMKADERKSQHRQDRRGKQKKVVEGHKDSDKERVGRAAIDNAMDNMIKIQEGELPLSQLGLKFIKDCDTAMPVVLTGLVLVKTQRGLPTDSHDLKIFLHDLIKFLCTWRFMPEDIQNQAEKMSADFSKKWGV